MPGKAIACTMNHCPPRFFIAANPPGSEESNGSYNRKCFEGHGGEKGQ